MPFNLYISNHNGSSGKLFCGRVAQSYGSRSRGGRDVFDALQLFAILQKLVVLEEVPKRLVWYDQARTRMGLSNHELLYIINVFRKRKKSSTKRIGECEVFLIYFIYTLGVWWFLKKRSIVYATSVVCCL